MGDGTADGRRRRYRALDGYRFLAALGIVVFHYNYDFRLGLSDISRAFDKLYVYVDFFFVLSGFVIAEGYLGRIGSPRAYGDFLWRRLARVYPLHLATLAGLVAGVELAAAAGWLGERHAIYDRGMIPQTALLLHAWGTTPDQGWNIPSWSISAEMFAYLAFPALALLALRLCPAAALAAAYALAVALQAGRQHLGLLDLTNATADGAMRVLPSFLAGIAVSRLLATAPRLPRVPWPAAHGLFLLPLALMHLGVHEAVAVALFPAVVLLAALAERADGPGILGSRAGTWLGDLSYALYMVHFPVALLALHVVAGPGWLDDPATRWCLWGGTLAAALALSAMVHRRFERPAQAWMLRLAKGSRPGLVSAPAA
jgi:peptidoglycan/LPS O-acetylase OafA/YrhL